MKSITLHLRVTPGVRKASVRGVWQVGDEKPRLRVAVSAPPHDGKANDAVRTAVAAALGLKQAQIHVTQGHTSRNKTLTLTLADGDVARVNELVAVLMAG